MTSSVSTKLTLYSSQHSTPRPGLGVRDRSLITGRGGGYETGGGGTAKFYAYENRGGGGGRKGISHAEVGGGGGHNKF